MDDMKAKEIFQHNLTEAEDDPTNPVPSGHSPGTPPPGRQYPPIPGRPLKLSGRKVTVPLHQPGSEMGEEDDITRMTAPRGQFNPKELSQLKDVLIMILANLAHSDLDMAIGQALMSGQELNPGQLQHIIDEARAIQVPDSHGPLLQKIFDRISRA
jgi:hypothetical protein